jgi:hypothetical protein
VWVIGSVTTSGELEARRLGILASPHRAEPPVSELGQ